MSGKKVIKSIQDRIISLKQSLAETVRLAHPLKWPHTEHIQGEPEKHMKFYLNQIERLNKQGQGPFVNQTKRTLLVKLVNFQGKSVALLVEVPRLCELPSIMNNFNQLVMQEFKILKMYVCFDLPLSTLNRVQAEQISDLDDFLRVESLQPSIEKQRRLLDSEASKTTSNGTPMNLL